jgi:hypothetical protein
VKSTAPSATGAVACESGMRTTIWKPPAFAGDS